MDHEAAWAKRLAQEQAHQRELLATFRGELGNFARECAAALTALDACVGGLGDVVTALQAGSKVHEHGKLVLDVTRRLKQLAPGSERPEETELYSSFGGEGNLPDRAVGHARRLLQAEPKRSDRELLKAVVDAAGVRARVEELIGPAPVAALTALSPLARWFPRAGAVAERDAKSARKTLTSVLEAGVQGASGEVAELAAAASLADSVRAAAEHAHASAKAVEEGRMRQVIAEARKQLKQDLDGLRGTLKAAEAAPAEWIRERESDHGALTAEVEEKLERLERMAGWLQAVLPRLQLASRALGSAEKIKAIDGQVDAQQPVTAEAVHAQLQLDLTGLWGIVQGPPGGPRAPVGERGRFIPVPGRGRALVAAAIVALIAAGAGIGAWVASGGHGKSSAAAGSTATATTPAASGPLNMRLYPIRDFLILQWINQGTAPIVHVTVQPQGFQAVSGSNCTLAPQNTLQCPEDIKPGTEPSSIAIDTKPPGATGSVDVTYKDAKGTTYGPVPVPLTHEEQPTTSTTSTTQTFPADVVYQGCVMIQPEGTTTVLGAAFTVSNPEPGRYRATFAETPSGRLSGTGAQTASEVAIFVPITATAFGTYDKLTITAPDGKRLQLGPLAKDLPLNLNASTDKPNGCHSSDLKAPPTSGTPSGTTPSASTPRAQAAQQYLQAVGPVNAFVAPFVESVRKWTSSIFSATVPRPTLVAVRAVRSQLGAIAATYPPAARDLHAQQNATSRVVNDLSRLSRLRGTQLLAWRQHFIADVVKLVKASKRVRQDLGLAAPSGP